jgi:hypothetical protein
MEGIKMKYLSLIKWSLLLVILLVLEAEAPAWRADPAPRPTLRPASGQQLLAARRRYRRARPKPRPKKAAPPKDEPVQPDPSPAPAPSPSGGGGAAKGAPAPENLQRGGRVEFDGRLVQGQTAKSGAIYLFARQRTDLRSMVRERVEYRKEILRTVNPTWGASQ